MKTLTPRLASLSLLLISLLSTEPLYAKATGSYSFSHIGIDNGLSNSFILWAVEDSQGAVWFTTEAGINRITGDGCTSFTSDRYDIPGNMATTLYYNREDDQIWLFTSDGLSTINCGTRQVTRHPEENQFHSRYVVAAADASDGGIWLGFKDGGLQHRDREGNYTTYLPDEVEGLGDNMIRYLYDDGHNHLLIGYNNRGMGVFDYNKVSAKYYIHQDSIPNSLPGNNVRIFVADQYHNIWVGTNRGLCLFDPFTGLFTPCSKANGFAMDTSGDNVMGLCLMNDGTLWMSSEPGGITILDLNDFATRDVDKVGMTYLLPTNSQLSSPHPRSIVQDKYGNIWICHYGTGIDVIESVATPFHIVAEPSQDISQTTVGPLRFAYGIASDSRQNVWIGGSSMLYRFYEGHIVEQWDLKTCLTRDFGKNYITYCDSHDNVWMGIDDVGALRFDPKTRQFRKIVLDEDFLDVHAFLDDSQGHFWIGSEMGVHQCFGDTARLVSQMVRHNQNNVIFALQEDALQRIWVGTFGSGIFIYDQQLELCGHLTTDEGLCDNNINQIYKDSDGSFWIATRGGLAYIKDPTHPIDIQTFGRSQGLTDEHIRAVCQDQLGSIWVSTHTTISCLLPRSQRFSNYNYHNGLPYGGFVESSTCTLADGTIFFASPNGICYFNPRLILRDEKVTPVRINTIESQDNYYLFSFSVTNYAQRNLVEYAYRLKGLDENWHNTLGDTRVTFRDLRPGHYTFQVKARLRNDDWDEGAIAETGFYIAPPLYLRWWALLGYLLIALTILAIIIYYYLHKVKLETYLKAEEKQRQDERHLNYERMRFYTNITHELRTPLTLILGPLEDLVSDKELSEPYHHRLQTIHSSALRLLGLINQILEFRKTETQNRRLAVAKDDLRKVVSEVGLRYDELNRNRQVKVRVQIPDQFPNIYFDTEVISTILNNLLSNAMKYTPKGTITLSLDQAAIQGVKYAEIKVSDTGYGISVEALPRIFDRYYQAEGEHQASGSGIGLAIVKSLATLHEGTIDVQSEVGKGSCFTFRILVDNTYPNALHKDDSEDKPVGSKPARSALPDEKPEADQRPVLLVVEDNDDIRQYILESFDLDYKVLTAANGKEGLDAALEHIPDIIVSDIMMPIMDGIELCKAIKGDMRTSHIPVVMLTAKDAIEDKETGYDSGADSYLTKPFSAKLLQSRIQNLLASRRHLAELLTHDHASDILPIDPSSTETSLPSDAVPRPAGDAQSALLNPLDQQFIDRLNRVIADNLSSDSLDITFLTDKMNMSSSTLYRKVKGLTSLSPNEYIRHCRLLAARQLLLDGLHNISETAYLTGFSSPNYFRDCFKAAFGVSPTEFIKNH